MTEQLAFPEGESGMPLMRCTQCSRRLEIGPRDRLTCDRCIHIRKRQTRNMRLDPNYYDSPFGSS